MKATKKIAIAACSLVAASALAAGSTFAWFSSNSEVEVTGMRLQAIIPDALFIEKQIVTDPVEITKTSLDFEDDSEIKLNPAVVDKDGDDSSKGVVKCADEYERQPSGDDPGEAKTYTKLATFENMSRSFAAAEGKSPENYATMYVMSLARINDKMDAKLQADVVFTFADDEDDNTYKFLRCGFLSETGWVSIPNESAAGYCEYNTNSHTVTFHYVNDKAVVTDFDGNKAYHVQFVVWFDGEDRDCYVNNALNTNNITVKITYTVDDTAANTPSEEGGDDNGN